MSHLLQLYQKIDSFEKQMSVSVKSSLQCKKGCSKCCEVDLSIFEVEANHIRSWFHSLSLEEKLQVKKDFQKKHRSGSCVFLRNESCSIYFARPLICRTQGMIFQFEQKDRSQIDVCLLNERALDSMLATDVLNLDLLNSMLSLIEKNESQDQVRPRISLNELFAEL